MLTSYEVALSNYTSARIAFSSWWNAFGFEFLNRGSKASEYATPRDMDGANAHLKFTRGIGDRTSIDTRTPKSDLGSVRDSLAHLLCCPMKDFSTIFQIEGRRFFRRRSMGSFQPFHHPTLTRAKRSGLAAGEEVDHQVAPGFRRGGVHALGFLHRHRHGLLAQYVQTVLQPRHRQRRVKLVGHRLVFTKHVGKKKPSRLKYEKNGQPRGSVVLLCFLAFWITKAL